MAIINPTPKHTFLHTTPNTKNTKKHFISHSFKSNHKSQIQTPPFFFTKSKMGKNTTLNDEQIASMKEAFTLFDTDGDGKIAPSELGILMRSLGGNPTQAQLKAIISEEKLTSPFDFNRFTELMGKHLKPEPFDRQLRDAFKVIDKDGTGFVVVADLKHILTSIGEKLEPAEFDEWIREIDVGSDGKIKYEDFIQRMVAK